MTVVMVAVGIVDDTIEHFACRWQHVDRCTVAAGQAVQTVEHALVAVLLIAELIVQHDAMPPQTVVVAHRGIHPAAVRGSRIVFVPEVARAVFRIAQVIQREPLVVVPCIMAVQIGGNHVRPYLDVAIHAGIHIVGDIVRLTGCFQHVQCHGAVFLGVIEHVVQDVGISHGVLVETGREVVARVLHLAMTVAHHTKRVQSLWRCHKEEVVVPDDIAALRVAAAAPKVVAASEISLR